MRKREIDELKNKLDLLKSNIISSIDSLSDNISNLNNIALSEDIEMGSTKSLVKVDENTLAKNNNDLVEINKALDKIKSKKYGKCEMCNEQIDIKRLRVKPHARYCISCREIYEKEIKISKGIKNGF
ncbi:MAG: RNA polymerase-binding protein DksA [Helicobacteraceae bacterium]|nr:RNA polymerase-binding protein DksA [Helicobacteraceae bacterium]